MKNKNIIGLLISASCLSIMAFTSNTTSTFRDGKVKDIDGNTYKTVKIGGQEWMAENLKVSRFRNGDEIPQAKSKREWATAGQARQAIWCFYEFNSEYGKEFGKLYNWYAVNDIRGLAPQGFHVPNKKEFEVLLSTTGESNVKGDLPADRLKESTGWNNPVHNGNNITGFSAVANGRVNTQPHFWHSKSECNWWMANKFPMNQAYSISLWHDCMGSRISVYHFHKRNEGLAVRCIED